MYLRVGSIFPSKNLSVVFCMGILLIAGIVMSILRQCSCCISDSSVSLIGSGEMLRKKRREKDGHKDPLLVEVNRLQENIMKEISELHKESDAADKKQSELDKVAQILGINIFEKPRKPSVETKDSSEKNSKSENTKGLEKATSSNKVKSSRLYTDDFSIKRGGHWGAAAPKHSNLQEGLFDGICYHISYAVFDCVCR